MSSAYLKDIEEIFFKFVWNQKRPRIAKAILPNKGKDRSSTICNSKLYYKATMMKSAWYHAPKRNQTDLRFSQLITTGRHKYKHTQPPTFDGAKSIHGKKDSLLNKWCQKDWISTCWELKLDTGLSWCAKVKSKWKKRLNIKVKTLNLLEEKIGRNLEDI